MKQLTIDAIIEATDYVIGLRQNIYKEDEEIKGKLDGMLAGIRLVTTHAIYKTKSKATKEKLKEIREDIDKYRGANP